MLRRNRFLVSLPRLRKTLRSAHARTTPTTRRKRECSRLDRWIAPPASSFRNFRNLKLGCIGIRFGEPIPYRIALAGITRESRALAEEDFRGTGETASGGNPIIIYVPNRANRRVHGIGIQHRPGMRNRNLFSFPFPFPFPGAALPKYFITSP